MALRMHDGLTRERLLDDYERSGKPRERWLVGAEFERHLLNTTTGAPLPYAGTPGVAWLLEELAKAGGSLVREGEHPIASVFHWLSRLDETQS